MLWVLFCLDSFSSPIQPSFFLPNTKSVCLFPHSHLCDISSSWGMPLLSVKSVGCCHLFYFIITSNSELLQDSQVHRKNPVRYPALTMDWESSSSAWTSSCPGDSSKCQKSTVSPRTMLRWGTGGGKCPLGEYSPTLTFSSFPRARWARQVPGARGSRAPQPDIPHVPTAFSQCRQQEMSDGSDRQGFNRDRSSF